MLEQVQGSSRAERQQAAARLQALQDQSGAERAELQETVKAAQAEAAQLLEQLATADRLSREQVWVLSSVSKSDFVRPGCG